MNKIIKTKELKKISPKLFLTDEEEKDVQEFTAELFKHKIPAIDDNVSSGGFGVRIDDISDGKVHLVVYRDLAYFSLKKDDIQY